ncbi:hypothetical protein [Micromonospora sp. URMC 103]|uniref:hypothetical protein n=1 Tax=Micromonospora sp. URMC 103 TaxID=3423406 RepID=UPI003F1B59ED
MTRKIDRPTTPQVHQALAELAAETAGPPPSVVALARRLGLSNTTFWRYYPDIARDVAAARRAALASAPHHSEPRQRDQLQAQTAELRRAIQQLTEQLNLAIANIQRLSIENDQLRRQLEAASKVARIPLQAKVASSDTGMRRVNPNSGG